MILKALFIPKYCKTQKQIISDASIAQVQILANELMAIKKAINKYDDIYVSGF